MTPEGQYEQQQNYLRERETRAVDALSLEQQRDQLITLRMIIREALATLQNANEGQSEFESEEELLQWLHQRLQQTPL